MTLILNKSDWDKMWQQTVTPELQKFGSDAFEEVLEMPQVAGQGYSGHIELSPGVSLGFADCEYHQDLTIEIPAHDHLIQINILLSGFLDCEGVHPRLDETRSYFSGSGVSPAVTEKHQSGGRLSFVNVEIAPQVLESFLDDRQRQLDNIKQLFKGEDWKVAFYPKVTAKMRSLAQELWHPPYHGAAKRLYLQAKVFELLALYVDLIADSQEPIRNLPRLKPDTIARIHHAKEILTAQIEHPPSLSALAQLVGVSDRTLQRGFQILFQTTVVGYLTQLRLDKAEKLLRQGDRKVAEVANLVGYGHLGHFSAAFKQRFGITPSQCLAGNKAVFGK
ncbi:MULTISPECIES: helix-turn-helix transcriptional regulator [unclassified Tolypothrix]|uniref:helix-turn-helix transcriptional regulator n=1 Tax=unclassified Tolypothrix TaxID=2649714 RepID=UPI0005EAC7A5|nr:MULTISPECIES: AraC family transcriptional regulator [unclassified Tolypothrix]BAY91126.1 transcriptional regulator [Microchaete diplosiphon NIES-3275]EKE99946.1 AraC family transcriptional regulator [Tolypothrix sp. PCC 7601]MBE9081428.1 helix-turn-helix transcriptional regulator [Tolypothrix sp. LEGE 11397]UYD25221.1 helix-turn-helix transcriptional regulator [Tolypothrix sp. PCC 7712]UYD32540.1 helix-turn-helix transcriptional regulator [Tolypothrix sp. PCC 7601]